MSQGQIFPRLFHFLPSHCEKTETLYEKERKITQSIMIIKTEILFAHYIFELFFCKKIPFSWHVGLFFLDDCLVGWTGNVCILDQSD